jgi:predicted Zn finger-like uncharacterized protein
MGAKGDAKMPLTGPAPEGKKLFCPKCGALYSVTRAPVPRKEAGLVKCVVCSEIMTQAESGEIPVYTLIHRPEEA